MIYLEHNALRIQELQASTVEIKLGEKRGEGSRVEFYSAGSYFSQIAGKELYLGIKTNKHHQSTIQTRAIYELGVIAAIAESIPNGLDYLPEIYGLIINNNGENVGIITEDFSQNGEFDVVQTGGAYTIFEDTFGKDVIDEDYSSSAGFTITSPSNNFIEKKWKLGDLYPLWPSYMDKEYEDFSNNILQLNLISEQIDKHTIIVDFSASN